MKKTLLFFALLASIVLAGVGIKFLGRSSSSEKLYVAVEGESGIAVINPDSGSILSVIDLSVSHDGGKLSYAPHNVQVSPDMKTVWVTANAGTRQQHASLFSFAYAHEEASAEDDEVIVINALEDKIIDRIPLGPGLHLAHVEFTPDSRFALVTAQNENVIYKIDTASYALKKIPVPAADEKLQEPHGVRISSDGSFVYVALLAGKGLGVLDLKTDSMEVIPLGGAAVQTGVTSDGKFAVVSLYDTKQIGVLNRETDVLSKIELPGSAKGPVQMFATPDSKYIYVADQGYYFGQPANNLVYKIDLENLKIVKEIRVGEGPHGLMVSGSRAYVTNLLSGDVSFIDTETDQETKRVRVGKEPNGISMWYKQ